MSDFEFVIPLSKEELLKKTNPNHYAVSEVLSAKTLSSKLKKVSGDFRTDGSSVIISSFDFFYSVLEHFNNLDLEVTLGTWKLIVRVSQAITKDLVPLLDTERLDKDVRVRHVNLTKMLVWLLCGMAEAFEASIGVILPNQNANKTSKKRATSSQLLAHWNDERDGGLQAMLSIVQLHISTLWDPPIVEEQFVNLITNLCYKTLENTSAVKYKVTKEHIASIIGIMVKKHKHCFSCSLKLLQLLQNSDQLVPTIAYITSVVTNVYGCQMIVTEIMREIGSLDGDELTQDSTSTRNMALLIVEMARLTPKVVLESISLVIDMLDDDPYTMRMGVLSVLEVLLVGLLREGMDERFKKTKQAFFKHLQAHILDVNAFVRNKVLQIWVHLISEKAVSMSNLNPIMPLVAGRVLDKSSMVRKSAIQVLVALIKSNQIATKFTVDDFKENYKKESEKLKVMKEEKEKKIKEKEKTEEKGDGGEMEEEEGRATENGDKEAANNGLNRMIESLSLAEGEALKEDDEILKQTVLVAFIKSSYEFQGAVDQSIQTISGLLTSKFSSDVIEAINFFYIGYKEGIKTCLSGIHKMLPLVASKEKEVKKAVVDAYKGVYLQPTIPTNGEARSSAALVAQSLIELTMSCNTFGKRVSLETLIEEFVLCGSITDNVIKVLWQTFIATTTPLAEKTEALVLIRFISNTKVEIIENNLDLIINNTLVGPDVDFILAMQAFITLSKLVAIQATAEDRPYKLPNNHQLFTTINTLMVQGMEQTEKFNWIPMSHQAIVAIYKLAKFPDRLCESIIRSQAKIILDKSVGGGGVVVGGGGGGDEVKQVLNLINGDAGENGVNETQLTNNLTQIQPPTHQPTQEPTQEPTHQPTHEPTQQSTQLPSTQQSTQLPSTQQTTTLTQQHHRTIPTPLLTRFLSTIGQISFNQLIFLDMAVYNELKRLKWKKSKEGLKGRQSISSLRHNSASSTKQKQQHDNSEVNSNTDDNWAEDVEADAIFEVTEKELLSSKDGLLTILKPIVVAVCSNQRYSEQDLCTSATSALCKLMIVSSEFCQTQLRLLFTLLERSPHPLVRSIIIISLSDLAQRFPNLIEPWTPNIFSRLKDESSNVRQTSVAILTRLILNDMIKVKGQISELTLSILDKDAKIADAAKIFFMEFSKKPNSIYNILPDIISRLSEESTKCQEDHFKPIMKFLISFIEKEKQSENLIEKFCHRIRATDNQKHCQDLCYCISLLPLNEKCIQKLMDNSACYYDRLSDDVVVQSFHAVVSNAKKCIKLDMKSCVGDFESWLTNQINRLRSSKNNHDNDNHNNMANDEEEALIGSFICTNNRPSGPNSAKKTANNKSDKPRRSKKPAVKKSKEEEEEDDDDDSDDDDVDFEEDDVEDKNKENNKNNNNNNNNSVRSKRGRSPSTSGGDGGKGGGGGRRVVVKKKMVISSSDEDIEFE